MLFNISIDLGDLDSLYTPRSRTPTSSSYGNEEEFQRKNFYLQYRWSFCWGSEHKILALKRGRNTFRSLDAKFIIVFNVLDIYFPIYLEIQNI